jgi:hypothetical protein
LILFATGFQSAACRIFKDCEIFEGCKIFGWAEEISNSECSQHFCHFCGQLLPRFEMGVLLIVVEVFNGRFDKKKTNEGPPAISGG